MNIYTENEIFNNPDEMIYIRKKLNVTKKERLHKHEFIELTYYLGGGAIHIINGHE